VPAAEAHAMTWQSQRSEVRWPWRDYLTNDERGQIEALDKSAAFLDERRKDVTARRNLIVNRAIQRAKAADKRKAKSAAAGGA
jgi:hypothetical protein